MKVNPPPAIKEEDTIELQVGSSLSRQLKVEGGTPPYTWSLAEGLLPDGVRLEKHGHIAGAASQAEEAPVTLVVEDRWAARSTKEVTLSFKAQDPDQQQQDKQDQDKQEQSPQDQQEQQDQDKQEQAQNQEDQENKEQGENKDDEDSKEGEENQEQAQSGQESDENQDAQDQQEAQIKQADIQRWLDGLPEESKRALLMQMLNGKASDKQVEDPW